MGEIFRHMVEIFRLDLMLQIGLATLLGGAIGLERELGGKPAGLRTNILICIGSVLYTHLSLAMLTGSTGAIPPGTDTTRVAAQIVTGVGFIGAGTILHARGAVGRSGSSPRSASPSAAAITSKASEPHSRSSPCWPAWAASRSWSSGNR